MKSFDYYHGREQTYLKHFFRERYLERVAYNIGSSASQFVYVDGFSGPWQSNNEVFEDTSFVIAVKLSISCGAFVRGSPQEVASFEFAA